MDGFLNKTRFSMKRYRHKKTKKEQIQLNKKILQKNGIKKQKKTIEQTKN